jgi:hypothetical protein
MSPLTFTEYNYPSEILDAICAQIFASGLPPPRTSLDPVIAAASGAPTAYPSSAPQAYWPEPIVRRTLSNLCFVNHAWYETAKPWLWKR